MRRLPLLALLAVLAACRGPATPTRPAASHAPVAASVTPLASTAPGAVPGLKPLPGATRELAGQVALDARYAVEAKAASLDHGVLSPIVANNGAGIGDPSQILVHEGTGPAARARLDASGAVIANNGAGVISDNGGGIIANNGGGIVSNHGGGWGLLAEDAALHAPLPAAGMLVAVVSMADGAFVPLGVDEAGKLAYAIYTDGQGRFKVTLPPKPAGNLLVVASPAGAQDPRLAVDLISPGGGAVQLDDGSTAVAGYLRRVMVARAADLLGIASCRPLPDQESALVKGLREALAAFAPTFQAAGFATLSPPAQQRVLLRFADAVLAGQALAEVQAAPQLLTSKTSKAQGPAVALLTDRFKALEAAAAKRLEADAGFFDRQAYMAIANRQVAGRAPYAIRKPADLTEFIVERYLTDNADDAYEWMEPIFQDCGLDPHDSVDVAAAGLGILARQAEVVKGEGEVASLQATIQKACAEEAAAGLAGDAAPCAASPAPGGPAYDVQTLAGTGEPGSQDGDGLQATFREPRSLAYDPAGWLYVCDGNALIRRIDLNGKDHAVSLVAGGQPGFQDGEGATARFNAPRGLTLSPDGALYVADVANQRLRKVDLADRAHVVVTTVAGDGTHGWADGPAATARFADAQGLALGPDGSLYVADTANHRIRKLAPDGAVTTVAGSDANGTQPGIGAEAGFKAPVGVALAPDGYLYVLDAMASIVQRVGPDGSVAHYAGSQGWPAAADGSFYGAGLSFPAALALGQDGALFVADVGNQRIRRLDPDGRITTIAGSGPTGYGNGGFADGPAASSRFADPAGIAVGKDGTVYVADTANHRIRMLVPR